MKTYFGVDYHKKYSHGTIMNEKGKILKQERFLNHREPEENNFSMFTVVMIAFLFWRHLEIVQ